MYFNPLSVKRILQQNSNDASMRADSWEIDVIGETMARSGVTAHNKVCLE